MRRGLRALRRSEADRARTDTGTRMSERRARTRRLIERGGLLAKSGLELALAAHALDRKHDPDTAAILLGALLDLTDAVNSAGDTPASRARLAAWQARGRAALRAGTAARDPGHGAHEATAHGGPA